MIARAEVRLVKEAGPDALRIARSWVPRPAKRGSARSSQNRRTSTPVTPKLGLDETLSPNRKVREVLGFEDEHNWRKNVPASQRA